MNPIRFFVSGVCSILCLGAPAFAASVSEVATRVNRTQYQHYLDDLLYAHTGQDRAYGTEHDMARTNIVDQLTAFGLQTSLEPFTYKDATYYNVVGVLPGKGARSNEVYLISGHFDSAQNDEGVGVPGADDDASGVAGVLEAARVLAQYQFDATLVFAAFDREEDGLEGSTAYVLSHAKDQIKGMISLDMIACSSGNKPEICCQESSKPLMLTLSNAFALYGGELTVSYGGPDPNADHYAFELGGFQACLLIEGSTNRRYHTLEDCLDTPNYIDYEFATGMTRATVGWMATVAGLYTDQATALTLQITTLSDEKVRLAWPASPAKVVVQTSSDLKAGSWSDLPANEIETEGANSVSVQPKAAGMRFYRLVEY